MLQKNVVLSILLSTSNGLMNFKIPPELYRNTSELLEAAGYPAQQHEVVTSDGYILRIFRIGDGQSTSRPPVLLMHGMILASDSWLLQGPRKDLAYQLYDAGFDVWMGDVRGNTYSRRHVTLSTENPAFWKFSVHEMGTIDVPAFIDYILNVTGKENLSYVGHSMGTSSFFILGSEKPEYMNKIRIFTAMAPVARMDVNHCSKEKNILIKYVRDSIVSFRKQGTYEIYPRVTYAPILAHSVCSEKSPFQNLCYDIMSFWAGSQTKRIARKVIPLILSHVPAGLSVDTPDHFIQTIDNSRFQQYDFGRNENMLRYKRNVPPEYNISRVTCPVAVHFSHGDFLINSSDVRYNIAQLPQVVYTREHEHLNHIDFIWGRTAWRVVYPDIVKILLEYNSKTE